MFGIARSYLPKLGPKNCRKHGECWFWESLASRDMHERCDLRRVALDGERRRHHRRGWTLELGLWFPRRSFSDERIKYMREGVPWIGQGPEKGSRGWFWHREEASCPSFWDSGPSPRRIREHLWLSWWTKQVSHGLKPFRGVFGRDMNEDMYDEEIFYCEELLSFYTLLRAKIIYHLRTGGNFSLGEDLACGDNFRQFSREFRK